MLTATFFAAGQTTHVLDLARGLVRRGHRVDLWVTHSRGGRDAHAETVAALEAGGVAVRFLPAPVIDRRLGIPQDRYDVVHAQSSWSFELARRLAALLGLPLVLTCHGLGLDQPAYRPALQAADRLICVGPRVARDLDAYRAKIAVVGNGVDLERFRPGIREGRFTLLYAGRVDRDKRPAVAAFRRAVLGLPQDVQVWAASNRRLGGGRIRNLGWVPDLERVMGRVHVVVGTGRVIREGLAAGAACLVLGREYHGPVTPEQVERMSFPDFSGNGRRLGPPDPAALLRDLLRLYRDRAWLAELMAFGRRYAEEHLSLDAMVDRTLAVYRAAGAAVDPAEGGAVDHGRRDLDEPAMPAADERAPRVAPEGDDPAAPEPNPPVPPDPRAPAPDLDEPAASEAGEPAAGGAGGPAPSQPRPPAPDPEEPAPAGAGAPASNAGPPAAWPAAPPAALPRGAHGEGSPAGPDPADRPAGR